MQEAQVNDQEPVSNEQDQVVNNNSPSRIGTFHTTEQTKRRKKSKSCTFLRLFNFCCCICEK